MSVAVVLLIGTFFFFILIRMPVVYAIGASSIITTIYLGLPLETVAQNMVKGINVFALLAVPFFILSGEIMRAGGIATRLIKLSNALIGWIRGGLAMVNILASMFFGGISGSSTADTSALGSILIPIMKKEGYDGEFATAVTMSSSVQGILIPPSHNVIIYSFAAGGLSIGKLFLGGVVPGVSLGLFLMIYSYIVSVKRNYPVGDKFDLKKTIIAFGDAFLGLVTVIIVVVGVIGGIFTATEAAAIACVYAFIITFFVYREISIKEFPGILMNAVKTISIVMVLIGTSSAFGWLLAYLRIPKIVANGILGFSTERVVVLLINNIVLLFLGMIMDMSANILITTPIFLPIVMAVGVDPIHFGIIMMLNLGIGLITPPVGPTLFIGSAISGISIEKLSMSMLPFFIVMLVALVFVTYIPGIIMLLPNLLIP